MKGAIEALRARRGLRTGVAVGAVAIVLLAVVLWHHFRSRVSTDDAYVDGPVVEIASKVEGTVATVSVEENQPVRAGQELVRVDPHDLQLALDRAHADALAAEAAVVAAQAAVPLATTGSSSSVQTARAKMTQARAGASAGTQAVEAARAHAAEAQAQLDVASQDVARLAPLLAKDEISRQDYDHAIAREKAARAAAAAATQGVQLAQAQQAAAAAAIGEAAAGEQQAGASPHQVEARRAEVQVAQAKAEQARAAERLAASKLADAVVRAPVSGVVGRRAVDPGERVQPGQPLLAIVPLERVYVTANFKETQIADMRPGQPAVIHVDAYGHDFKGHVESLGAATGAKFSLLPAENASGNFVKVVQRVPVRIALEKGQDPEHLLRPGMSVVPTVVVK